VNKCETVLRRDTQPAKVSFVNTTQSASDIVIMLLQNQRVSHRFSRMNTDQIRDFIREIRGLYVVATQSLLWRPGVTTLHIHLHGRSMLLDALA
jgi:hypothetical protein